MLAVHLAHLTPRLRIGCGFNIAPMWHPLRLAEDYATADVLTEGRVTFGVGRGYHTREVETFGAPLLDQDGNRELFEEQVEVIIKAFREASFSHHGKHYTAAERAVSRLHAGEPDAGAAAGAFAGVLAADPGRLGPCSRLHGEARHRGHNRRRRGRGRGDGRRLSRTSARAYARMDSRRPGRGPQHRVPFPSRASRRRRAGKAAPGTSRRTSRCWAVAAGPRAHRRADRAMGDP